MKELVYEKNITLDNMMVGLKHITLVISGRIYKHRRKFLFWKLSPKYTFHLSIPYIEDPLYDGEYATNRILQTNAKMLSNQLYNKMTELENNIK